MERFYPNECCVCKSANNIKRCARCQMISYCGKDHQNEHWKYHKDICNVISTMMNEQKVSHLFEKLRGSDSSTWIQRRKKIAEKVQAKLGRSFRSEEVGMFKFPRACFVCHDTRPDKLKKCPGCSSANFCSKHPTSLIHDRICSIIKNRLDLITQKEQWDPRTLKSAIEAIGAGTIFSESGDLPTSMREFMDLYIKPKIPISENLKIFLSPIFTYSLTLFSVLQKLSVRSSEIVLHVDVGGPFTTAIMNGNCWEVLLHFLPDTKILKIVHIEGSITHKSEVFLCKKCRSGKKRLFVEANSIPYERYLTQRDYQKPNVIAYLNASLPEKDSSTWKICEMTFVRMSKVNCPMVFTALKERGAFLIREILTASTTNFLILYHGYNNFAPLNYIEELEDGSISQFSQFMIIFRHQEIKEAQFASNNPSETKVSRPRSFYYATVCQVCRSPNPKVTCNRCRMIFYCGNKHRDEHQIHHRDLCKVILSMLSEMGAPNLFDKLKTADPDLWLRARVDLMRKAKLKIGRQLEEYEEQMFLFPKTCMVCHESDLSVLRNCECGVNLCKIHKGDPKHQKLCSVLTLAFKLITSETKPALHGLFLMPVDSERVNLPPSMQAFIDSHINFQINTSNQKVKYQNMATSNFLTGPLTLLYALERLNYQISSSMVIHIIGAGIQDLAAEGSWKIFLYWLTRLINLKIVFIGTDISNCLETQLDTSESFPITVKNLKVQCHGLRYYEYFKSESFMKPNIILGCNLDIHESELGISECTWKDTILTLKKVGVPFVLTAGTKERAEKDHKRFCKLLGMSVPYKFCEVNPYAALSPERDFETEGVRYSNKHIIIYDGKYKKAVKLEKVEGDSSIVENYSKLEELSDCQINRIKAKRKLEGNHQMWRPSDKIRMTKTALISIIADNFRIDENVGPDGFPICSDKIRVERVNLYKIHKADPKHQKLCSVLTLAFKLIISEIKPALHGMFLMPVESERVNLQPSMQDFIDSHITLQKNTFKQKLMFENMATSNYLSGPLTLLYALKRINYKISSSMSKFFLKPNIILGCNLDIYQSELEISYCTWKHTISSVKKVGVPYILTAKDQNTLSKMMEMSVDYTFYEANPYAALSPERDFKTEGVRYSAKYVIIYDGK
ncbi:uncharacterized protein LOC117173902 [Belonocnema kinseyi]|uniref:uncharacterized protein LOC117173902 n=1 Tax=Belonocnema kinseyi TaxID=2817044 RepID=UPI00143D0C32|nr:uncharacterized protein LOC117173902 [Belonocnema kinseyi]